jgi:Holliday junction DNA helicase RuvB
MVKPEDMEVLEKIAGYEDNTPPEEWRLGSSWRDVRAYPATLNRLVVEGFLETVFKSNSYTGYKLTESARALLIEGGPVTIEIPRGPPEVSGDALDDVLGHEGVKELILAAMAAPRPVHVLLVGPLALAKSRFLWDLERVAGDRALWVLGSSSSKAGLQESLLEKRPWLLLIDELDKMDGKDQGALMSLMEGGRVTRTKVGKIADVALECRVVAGLLQRREELDQVAAEEVARALGGRTQDVRDAVRVARLAGQVGVKRAVELLLA